MFFFKLDFQIVHYEFLKKQFQSDLNFFIFGIKINIVCFKCSARLQEYCIYIYIYDLIKSYLNCQVSFYTIPFIIFLFNLFIHYPKNTKLECFLYVLSYISESGEWNNLSQRERAQNMSHLQHIGMIAR